MVRKAEKILKMNKLRETNVRIRILLMFLNYKYAIPYSLIKDNLDSDFNEATIYRNLSTFLDKHIIHRIPQNTRNTLYALSFNQDQEDELLTHSHLYCKKCRMTYCINSLKISCVMEDENINISKVNIIAEGICKDCKNND